MTKPSTDEPSYYLRRKSDGKYCRGARFYFWCTKAKYAAKLPMSYWNWWLSFDPKQVKGIEFEFIISGER